MKTEMLMPQMGESIAEATILKWLKNPGDMVEKDETILEISTDKVDSEIPAPASGKIVEIIANEGDTVAVKSVIAIIYSDSSAAVATPSASSAGNGATPAPSKEPAAAEPAPAPQAAPTPPVAAAPVAAAPAGDGTSASKVPTQVGERFYSPLVRSLAAKHGLTPADLAAIPGTGKNGRVTKDDLMLYLEHGAPSSAPAAKPASSTSMRPAPTMPQPTYGADGIKVEPMDNMRKLIAEHMVRSKATSPHVYSMSEADVTNLAKWRKQHQAEFTAREGFKLTLTPFFLEATVKALMNFPKMNSSVDGETLVMKRDINLGCAVALGKDGLGGLIVPVIKNAGSLNFVGLARALNDLVHRARNKKLVPDDVQGGTFTITNPGIFGNTMGCPIINQPQLGILAIGKITKRPIVIDDAIAIRDHVVLTMSYDHRVIDGAFSGHFMSYIVDYLENWDMNRGI